LVASDPVNDKKLRRSDIPPMANTYSQIHIQVVFAVTGRESLIQPRFKAEMYKYISGVTRNQGQKLLAINGMPDHVHLLIGLRPDVALSDLVRDIKTASSKLVNQKKWLPTRFSWQEGFGAFSYGYSQLDSVIRYIQNQETHHARQSFKTEYFSLLRKFDIAFEDKYIFDFVDDVAPTELEAS
jgi:putative transposase